MDEKPYTTLRAIDADIPRLVDLLTPLLSESRYGKFMTLSPERAARTFGFCIEMGFCELVQLNSTGEAIGAMCGILGPTFFAEDLQAIEFLCYAKPEWRGQRVCEDLVVHFVGWARSRGAVECLVGSSANINNDGVRHFYQRMGFEVVGELMSRRT